MTAGEIPKRSRFRTLWFALMACLVGLACNIGTPGSNQPGSPPPPTAPAPSPTDLSSLATPYAQEPASGICASFDGPVAEFRIEPGIPDPRCARVRPDQQLKVTNKTDGPLEVSIGPFLGHLEPEATYTIEAPFGSYLAPGVHVLQVTPCCGPELVLEPSPQ